MINIALITEGITDQIVIENILIGLYKEENFSVNFIQPLRDETDRIRQKGFGSWFSVFELCKSSRFQQIFQTNNYVIIQIDTDVSDEPNFDIPKYKNNKELTVNELILKVQEKIIDLISQPIYQSLKDRIIFAICVHSLECWLLPIFSNVIKADRTKGCLGTLNTALRKKGQNINPKDKDIKIYRTLSSCFRKNKELKQLSTLNPSFKIFIKNLEATVKM